MTKYEKQFELLGLSTDTPANYKSAELYSRSFERCSILSNSDIVYSSTTGDITQKSVLFSEGEPSSIFGNINNA